MLTEKELGERLKNIREVRRISQFRLGEMVECGQGHIGKLEKSGVSRNSIRNLETGKCMSFLLTYQYIAEALGVTVGTLLGETGGAE